MTGPADILHTAARRHLGRTALVTATRTLTYAELDAAAAAVAGGLRDRGIAPGDVVTLYAPNRWEWLAAYHGVLRAGAIVNPVNALLTAEELNYVTGDCRAAAVITTGALR